MIRDFMARNARTLLLVKWSVMVWATVWMLVFRLGGGLSAVPEFVYVNF